ncbi:unnamed protein product [Discula destructiva]
MSSPPAFRTGDEDLIVLSPAKPSVPASVQKQEEDMKDEPDFIEHWLNTIEQNRKTNQADREKMSASNRANHDHNDDDGEDSDENETSLNPISPTTRPPPANKTDLTETKSIQNSRSTGTTHQNSQADSLSGGPNSPRLVSESDWVPIHSPGCIVTVESLPVDITIRDILARISNGEIRGASLVKVQQSAGMCAVITFKEPRDAMEFVHISESYEAIWTFQSTDEEQGQIRGKIVSPKLVDAKLLHSPDDIPLEPRPLMSLDDNATRCLVIKNCAFEMMQEIWHSLRLSHRLKSPHYRNNLDDIWVDGFRSSRDGSDRIEYANLHIWYTCTELAIGAKKSIRRRSWAKSVGFEADPCDGKPYELFFRPANDPGIKWRSLPSQSLLEAHKNEGIDKLFAMWDAISAAVKESRPPPKEPKERKMTAEEPMRDTAERGKVASEKKGLDLLTLMSMIDPKDFYEFDYKGGREHSRIDTRNMYAGEEAKDSVLATDELLRPIAYVDALIILASEYLPAITVYSPGTPTSTAFLSYSELGYNDETVEKKASSPNSRTKHHEDVSKAAAPPSRYLDYTQDPEIMREALKNPKRTHWFEVSVAEYTACDEDQRKLMGTSFYLPPKGYNSLEKHPWL